MNQSMRSLGLWCLAALLVMGGLSASPTWAKKPGPDNVDPAAGAAGGGNGKNKVKLPPGEKKAASMREKLQVTDDAEWGALQARLVKVAMLSKQYRELHDAKATMEGPKLPRKADGAGQASGAPAYSYPAQVEGSLIVLGEKAAAARAELLKPDATAANLQARLNEFRQARSAADQLLSTELKKARDELRELVTPRQELTLVASGLLD